MAARRPVELGRSFLRGYGYLVVQEIAPHAPPRPNEFAPETFDVTSPFGRYYTTVLVRSPDSAPNDDPTALVFHAHAPCVRLVARRGRFWLFDTSACIGR